MDFKVGQRVRVINTDKTVGSCPVPLGTLGIVVQEANGKGTFSTLRVNYDNYHREFVPQYLWRFAPATPDDPHADTDF